MIRVRLLKDYKDHKQGEAITVSGKTALVLFKKGVAMRDKMLTRQDFIQ